MLKGLVVYVGVLFGQGGGKGKGEELGIRGLMTSTLCTEKIQTHTGVG